MKALLSLLFAPLFAAAQNVNTVWNFPAEPCGFALVNCMMGGVAYCSTAFDSGAQLAGDYVHQGFDLFTCGTDYVDSDQGTLYSSGWPAVPDADHFLMFSATATVALVLDSITATTRSNGDQSASVFVGIDEPWPTTPSTSWTGAPFWFNTIAPLGIALPAGSTINILVQGSNEAAPFWIDRVKLSAHVDGSTGVAQLAPADLPVRHPATDVLGRPVNDRAAPGVYVHGARRVVVVQ